MELEKLSETSLPTMDILRHAYARCCKVLGLDQETSLALTLMLNSREALMTMLWAMREIEDRNLNQEVKDMTTLVVNIAVQIREKEGSLRQAKT